MSEVKGKSSRDPNDSFMIVTTLSSPSKPNAYPISIATFGFITFFLRVEAMGVKSPIKTVQFLFY